MKKRLISLVVAGLVLTLALAACGDSTNTAAPVVTSGSAAGSSATTSAAGSMPSMTMGNMMTTTAAGANATTVAATTAAATSTTVRAATTAATTTMAGMGSMTTAAAGTTTMAGMGSMTTAAAMAGNDPMTEMLKPLTGAAFETNFMQMMIMHHQDAVDMAKLVPTNTKRPELIKLSQDIIAAQNKEIGDMTKWLADWHKAKPSAAGGMAGMNHSGMGMSMGDMNKLKAAKDAAFDKMFITMMIEHHQSALNMANLLPARTQRPELLKLGQDIVKSQSAEITQMQGWQKAWV